MVRISVMRPTQPAAYSNRLLRLLFHTRGTRIRNHPGRVQSLLGLRPLPAAPTRSPTRIQGKSSRVHPGVSP